MEESAPRCPREPHADTDPAIGTIDQWHAITNQARKKPALRVGFSPFLTSRQR
jgi:hypothetical protein